MTQRKSLLALMAVVGALALERLVLALRVEMLPEEAYYWTYTQYPAFGYFDHPPMVAWVVRAGTLVFGDTELGVRFGHMVLLIGCAWLVWLTARTWFDEQSAWYATLLFALLPIFSGMGLIVTPDAPLVFFWLATLYAIGKAVTTKRGGWWLLAGVAFGGALQSKYTAVLLAPSLLMFLLLSPAQRYWLRRPQPWLALAVAIALFSPVVVWNAQHDWASFAFQSTRTAGRHHHDWIDIVEFWGFQLIILTPVLFWLYLLATVRGIQRGWLQRDERWNFAVSFSLPFFLVFVLASFKTDTHINWTAPAFLSMLPAMAALYVETTARGPAETARRWRVGAGVAVGLCVALNVAGLCVLGWSWPVPFKRAGGWRELARQTTAATDALAKQTGQQPFVLGADKYNLAAELGFYTAQPRECVNLFVLGERGLSYNFWTDLQVLEGRPAVALTSGRSDKVLAALRDHFDRVEPARRVDIVSGGVKWREVEFVSCYGYHAKARR